MPPPLHVGVLTLHRCINYGSYWQARCLVDGLKARGHRPVLLDHDCPHVRRAEWRCALNPVLPYRPDSAERKAYAAKARRFFAAQENFPLSRRFPLDDPRKIGPQEAVVVGSDEVWNTFHPWYGRRGIFFGEGLEARRLVSYAASFGTHAYHTGLECGWAGQLRRFDAISVRDENSRRLIADEVKAEAELVLDPCLQFPPGIADEQEDRRYAVVYGHSFPRWFGEALRRWAAARGLRLVSVGYGNAFADENRIGAGPEEFARLMRGASAIATNFFHGCVFALLNARPFVCFASWYRFNKISDLVNSLGAAHHVVAEDTPYEILAARLDAPLEPAIAFRVSQARRRSTAYLDRALG